MQALGRAWAGPDCQRLREDACAGRPGVCGQRGKSPRRPWPGAPGEHTRPRPVGGCWLPRGSRRGAPGKPWNAASCELRMRDRGQGAASAQRARAASSACSRCALFFSRASLATRAYHRSPCGRRAHRPGPV